MSKILITGGSGFLGRGFLRANRRDGNPHELTIYSRDETKQFEVKRRWPEACCVLGDVRDAARLEAAMAGHDTVIHAGAVKYIPEAEHNVAETIAVNVEGSLNVARAATRVGIRTVVGVSTDKACSPLNTYGASKMLMERAFAEANRWSDTRFITVRYGNVVGSTGSVIPLFIRQLRETGQMTVTDGRMTRFWLSIDNAVELVYYAAKNANAAPGCTVIPSCGAMSLQELASAVGRSEGKTVWGVKTVGIRPGEKMHESLFNEQEAPRIETYGSYYLLWPATSTAPLGELTDGFSSEFAQPIQGDDMTAMIQDAKDVWM